MKKTKALSIILPILSLILFVSASRSSERWNGTSPVPPLQHEKRIYASPDGKIFVARELPVFLHLSPDPGGKHSVRLKDRSPKITEKNGKGDKDAGLPVSLSLKEGLNIFMHPAPDGKSMREIKVYADSAPPQTETLFSGAMVYTKNDCHGIDRDTGQLAEKPPGRKNRRYYGRSLELRLTARDTMSGVKETYMSINGSSFIPYKEAVITDQKPGSAPSAPTALPTFIPGIKNNLRYYSVDNVGNVEKIKEISFYLDEFPPLTQMAIRGDRLQNILSPRSVLMLTASDSLSGVKSIFYRFDNGKKQRYEKPIDIAGLEEGPHALTYFAADQTGNIEPVHTYDFFYDKSPPNVSLRVLGDHSRQEDVVFVSSGSRISMSATDNKAGTHEIRYRIDSPIPETYLKPFGFPNESGYHQVRYHAVDRVKNSGEHLTRRFYMDITPPSTEYKIGGYYIETESKGEKSFIIRKEVNVILAAADLESGVKVLNYQVNHGQVKKYKKPLSFETHGPHTLTSYTLTYYACDNVNNWEEKKTVRLIVDSSPLKAGFPVPAIQLPKRWYKSKNGRLIGSVNHPFYLLLSPRETREDQVFFLDLKKLAEHSGQPVTFQKEGLNYLRIPRGKNGEVFDLFRIYIDGTAPVCTPEFSEAETYVQNEKKGKIVFFGPGLVLRFNGNDRVKNGKSKDIENRVSGFNKVFVAIDGSPFFTYTVPLEVFKREKIYKCSYYSVDNVGNSEPVKRLQFTVDTTPPVSRRQISGLTTGRFLSTRSIITLSADDNSAGVRQLYYGFDENAPKPYRHPIGSIELKRLNDGEHRLFYYAVDNVGNAEERRRVSINVDHSGPQVILNVRGDQYKPDRVIYVSHRSRIVLEAEDSKTGVKTILYRIGDGETVSYSEPFPITGNSGTYTLWYSGLDGVGNRAEERNQRFILDKNPPLTDINLMGPVFRDRFHTFISTETGIRLVCSETGAGLRHIRYHIDGGPEKNYTQPFHIFAPGEHSITFYARDMVGNIEQNKTENLFVDNEPPTIKIKTNVTPRKDTGKKILIFPDYLLISLLATDASTEVDKIVYRVNGGREHLYRNPLSGFETGKTYRLRAAAYDRLGNRTETRLIFRIN